MKTKHLINLFFLFAVIPAFAQETGAQINFETTTIDYGTIANGSDGERVFNFTNSGNKDLIIQNVQSSCGCTIPKKPEGPIAPGESSEIIVKYDTKDYLVSGRIGHTDLTVKYKDKVNLDIIKHLETCLSGYVQSVLDVTIVLRSIDG